MVSIALCCRNYSVKLTVIAVTSIVCVNFTAALLALVGTTRLVSCGRRLITCVSAGRHCHGT